MWLTWLEAIDYCPCRVIPLLQMHSCGKIDIHLHGLIFFSASASSGSVSFADWSASSKCKNNFMFYVFYFYVWGSHWEKTPAFMAG